jgi:hypothetical protein
MMTRNLKALGLALAAVLALSAIAAQGASAVPHKFEITKIPADITSENVGNSVFETTPGGVKVECTKTTATGTVAEPNPTSITLTPKYEGCTSPIGAAVVTDEGCAKTLTVNNQETTPGPTAGVNTLPVDLKCTAGGRIKMALGGCGITFSDVGAGGAPVNQNLHGARYTNKGVPPKEEVTIETHLAGIHYFAMGANCAILGIPVGTAVTGVWKAHVTMKAYEDLIMPVHNANTQTGLTVKGAPNVN